MKSIILFTATIIILVLNISFSQIPHTLSYQGVLTDTEGNARPDNMYSFTFRLYTTENGGAPIWEEPQSLHVQRGLFSAILGSVIPFGSEVTFDRQYWLSVEVAPDPELSPRIPLTSVGYSMRAGKADVAQTISDGQIVRSINNMNDNIIIQGAGGATVTTNGDTLFIITSGNGTGGGVAALQNTDNALNIINPVGPTTTINLKSPFTIPGNTGIGTNNPVTKLDVRGHLTLEPDTDPILYTSSTSGEKNRYLQLINSPASPSASGIKAGGILVSDSYGYANPGKNDVVVKGNVAIGATSTLAKLQVTGSALVSTPFRGISINQNYGAVPDFSGYSIRVQTTDGGSFPPVTSTDFIVTSIGNVGIGTNAPGSTLTVTGPNNFGNASASIELRNSVTNRRYGIGSSTSGHFQIFDRNAGEATRLIITSTGNVGIGTINPTSKLEVVGRTKTQVLEITGGSDLAEPFDTVEEIEIEPGTVMVIDEMNPGKLTISKYEYDRKVAGIVSGAGGVNAGITLSQEEILEGSTLIALTGRVYCKAEAFTEPIRPGDLLTTSSIAGHVKKATDLQKMHGAIVGKAMTGLDADTGLILVLVNLQ